MVEIMFTTVLVMVDLVVEQVTQQTVQIIQEVVELRVKEMMVVTLPQMVLNGLVPVAEVQIRTVVMLVILQMVEMVEQVQTYSLVGIML